jgi:hypothetical protein
MREFLTKWQFWVSVVVVAFVTHWAMNKFMPSAGSA